MLAGIYDKLFKRITTSDETDAGANLVEEATTENIALERSSAAVRLFQKFFALSSVASVASA